LVYGVQNEKAQQVQLSNWKEAHATSGKDNFRQTEVFWLFFLSSSYKLKMVPTQKAFSIRQNQFTSESIARMSYTVAYF